MSYCIGVPHYNHLEQFREFLPRLIAAKLPIIIVDDGSSPLQKQGLASLVEAHQRPEDDITLHGHEHNRGKGAALITAAYLARSRGHTHLVQIDADGQHDAELIPRFVKESQQHPHALISGAPRFDADAPKARRYGRKVTDFFVALETLSLQVKDSLCGFRVYPLLEFERVLDQHYIASGMGIDTDMIVKSRWEGVALRFIDTDVRYVSGGVSHFRYLQDNLQLIALHVRLLFGTLLRLPRLLRRPGR